MNREDRIRVFAYKIIEIHERNPELRIGQILDNFNEYVKNIKRSDIYYIGDIFLIKYLEDYVNDLKEGRNYGR